MIGIIAFLIVVGVIVYCVYNMKAEKNAKNGTPADQTNSKPSNAVAPGANADIEKGTTSTKQEIKEE